MENLLKNETSFKYNKYCREERGFLDSLITKGAHKVLEKRIFSFWPLQKEEKCLYKIDGQARLNICEASPYTCIEPSFVDIFNQL